MQDGCGWVFLIQAAGRLAWRQAAGRVLACSTCVTLGTKRRLPGAALPRAERWSARPSGSRRQI